MSEQERKEWPFRPGALVRLKSSALVFWHVEHCEKVVSHGRTRWVVYGPCATRHWADDVEVDGPKPDELTQLRTQLADATRIISELQAAQGIAGIELKRLRECNKALRQHVKALAAKLKANGVRA